jgi:hypothetical protein
MNDDILHVHAELFSRDLREFVQRTKIFPLPEYDLDIEQGREADVLCISGVGTRAVRNRTLRANGA